MATMSGQPLYVAAGYQPIEPIVRNANGVVVPMVRMGKALVIED
jgi:hypothetical protein